MKGSERMKRRGRALIRPLLLAAFALLPAGAAAADGPKTVRTYIFGNSLIHHLTPSDETTVPHWVHRLAATAGNRYAVDGQWGFPENFVKDLPPIDQWAFKGVPGVWDRQRAPFDRADYDTIVMNPANFIQDTAPDASQGFLGLGGKSQVDVALALFDWLENNGSGSRSRYFIYEGWATMEPFSKSFPPSAQAMQAFHAHNRGKYHDWYARYVRLLNQSRPGLDVRLIPVASVLSKLLSETPLEGLEPADLYTDIAPHGTATTYFLAAVIVYSMLYDAKAPADFAVPASVHPLVREHYPEIIEIVCAEVLGAGTCKSDAAAR
jgi:hypothetical protein